MDVTKEQLEQCLQAFLVPDNEVRKTAEANILKLLKTKACIKPFLEVIVGSENPTARALAATLLRKKISPIWRKLDNETQQRAKEALLAQLPVQQEKFARMAVAHLIALVTKLVGGEWEEVIAAVGQVSGSQEPMDRVIGVMLVVALTETMPDLLIKHLDGLATMLVALLQDGDQEVRTLALRAGSKAAVMCEDGSQLAKMDPVITAMLAGVAASLSQPNQDREEVQRAIAMFDVFEDLLASKLPDKTLAQTLDFGLQVAAGAQLHLAVRERAVCFLMEAVEARGKKVDQLGKLDPIMQCGLKLLGENPDTDIFEKVGMGYGSVKGVQEEDDDEEDEMGFNATSPVQMGCMLFAGLGGLVKSSRIYPPIRDWSVTHIQGSEATAATSRAAIFALSNLCEGCRDKMRKDLPTMLEMLRLCSIHASPFVKQAAAYALSVFVEYLQPEILEHHEFLIKTLIAWMNDPDEKLRQKACHALDVMGEDLGDHVLPFADELLNVLTKNISAAQGDQETQGLCLSAMGSIACAMGESFAQHVNTLSAIKANLVGVMQMELDPRNPVLRSRATEAVGVIVVACGRQLAEDYWVTFQDALVANLKVDVLELHEFTFACLSNFAESLEADFLEPIKTILPTLCEYIESESELTEHGADSGVFGGPKMTLPSGDEDDSDDDLSDGEEFGAEDGHLRIRTAELQKRTAAIKCVGVFAKVLGAKFHEQNWTESTYKVLEENFSYFHEEVRGASLTAATYVLRSIYLSENKGRDFNPGDLDNRVTEVTERSCDSLITELFQRAEDEDSKDGMISICDCFAFIAETIGPVGVHKHIDKWKAFTISLLKKELYCQMGDDEEDEEEEFDHEELTDSFFEMIDTFARAYGPRFSEFWQEFMPIIRKKYLKRNNPPSDHVAAVGTYAEVLQALGTSAQIHVEKMLEVFRLGLGHEDQGCRSNSILGVGVACMVCPDFMDSEEKYGKILEAIKMCLTKEDQVRDNALGTLCRLIMTRPQRVKSLLPEYLRVLFENLPLRKDFTEYERAYQCVGFLLEKQPQELAPMFQEIMRFLVFGLGNKDVPKDAKGIAATILSRLQSSSPEAKQFLQSLPPEQQAVVARHVIL